MRIVCLSDTHNLHDRVAVPDGDLLLHAGDATMRGTLKEVTAFVDWLAGLPHRHKVVVAGNHDWLFQREPVVARALVQASVAYLQDAAVEVEGLRIWGSPWQPEFMDWAFNLPRGAPLREKWDRIPEGTDVLITHGPPHGILDRVDEGRQEGCRDLREAVGRVRPRLHLFGHIHEAYGVEVRDGTTFANASVCDRSYRPVNPPVVADL
jgi:Icc-related predicted phosphoesterase